MDEHLIHLRGKMEEEGAHGGELIKCRRYAVITSNTSHSGESAE
jgi:hypothetical protein